MKVTATGFQQEKSHYGGEVFVVFFKTEEGKSARTWLYPKNRNFQRWRPVLDLLSRKQEAILDGVRFVGCRLIDADSMFTFSK
jgi:hypothetical protein